MIKFLTLFWLTYSLCNILGALIAGKMFAIGFRYNVRRDMTAFQMQQEYSKMLSLGSWIKKGESGFKTTFILNIAVVFLILYFLKSG